VYIYNYMKPVHYNRLKGVLADLGKTNKELAEGIGVLPNTVSTWCTNVKQPSWEKLYAIADYLKVDVRELLVPNEKSPKKDFKF
jgi:transcriptional regulator with XRE-family HTH domain